MIPRGGISGSQSGLVNRNSQIGIPRDAAGGNNDPLPGSPIIVNWRSPTIGTATGYRVERGTTSITFTFLANTVSATYTDTPPADGSYYYNIIAKNADGDYGPGLVLGPLLYSSAGSPEA